MNGTTLLRKLVLTGILAALFSTNVLAVNGIAVSIKESLEQQEEYDWEHQGSIERFDIQDSKVTGSSIICSTADGMASWPSISQDGSRVCFFRNGNKWVNGATDPSNTTDYVSVVNIDGTGLRNLVEFTGTMATYRWAGGSDRFIDWPAGDWIYYQKPTTLEIWRVNVTTLATNVVATYTNDDGVPYLGHWNLNADGTRACHGGLLHRFPSLTYWKDGSSGCNHTLSASGRFLSGWLVPGSARRWPGEYNYAGANDDLPYQGRQLTMGDHDYFEFTDWNWSTDAGTKFGISFNDYVNYRHISYMLGTAWLQETIGQPQVGDNSMNPRWAANSDKWTLHEPAGRRQILYNWVDREVILTTRERDGYAASAGDFWVRPPDNGYIGTRYEDCRGVWQPLGTQSTAALPDYISCPGCANPWECAAKYRSLVIMPQTAYDLIAGDNLGFAVVIPDISTIVVQKSSSIALTVTNEVYDPVDPIFGKPPSVSWRVIGQGASVSPASGAKTTLTTTSAFSSCSVEVSITVGSIVNTSRKLAASQAVAEKGPGNLRRVSPRLGARISPLAGGGVSIAVPGYVGSIDVVRADGALLYSAAARSGSVAVPAAVLTAGMCVFRLNRDDGGSINVRWVGH